MTSNPSRYEENFEQLGIIGEGGFGKVFEVKEKTSGALFAIKRIEIKGLQDYKEILREVKLTIQLNSEYVVKYYDTWTEEKVIDQQLNIYVYIQMDLYSQNMRALIELINTSFDERFNTIKYIIGTKLFLELIECINYLHSKSIIHRDLKPENILVTDGENARLLKLGDFGLSKKLVDSFNTRGVGTPYYWAPEITDPEYYDEITGTNRYNLKADIYSLGVIATELFGISLNNVRNLTNLNSERFSNPILREKFVKLMKIISSMVSKEKTDRPGSAGLLEMSNEWRIDQDTLTGDEYYSEFVRIVESNESLKIFKKLI